MFSPYPVKYLTHKVNCSFTETSVVLSTNIENKPDSLTILTIFF